MKQIIYRNGLAQQLIVAMILSVTVCLTVQGQTWTQYDQGTPPQHAAGVAPLGSYLSTGIGNVNLANGSLNISLPMGAAGGRGFEIPITLNFNSKVWSTAHETAFDPQRRIDVSMAYARYGAADLEGDIFDRVAPGWKVSGTPIIRVQHVYINQCVQGYHLYHLTKLTVVLPDKGEIQMRDDLHEGEPLYAGCVSTFVEDRGRRWHATNGSGAIFISDNPNGVVDNDLAGTLIMPDGTRYRFQNDTGGFGTSRLSRCMSITDRNGNQITINRYTDPLDSAHITTDYIDQMGRTVKVEHNAPDPANPSVKLAVLVTVKGYLGAAQYYKVKTDFLSNNIRADFGYTGGQIVSGYRNNFGSCSSLPAGSKELFPGSYCEFRERIDNKTQVTELILPDNRSLHFKYNLFGEVAEVSLPTGGILQYDYATNIGGLPSGNSLPFEYQGQFNAVFDIDRAVSEQRNYPDGVNLEGSTTYAFIPQTVNGASRPCADVRSYQGSSSTGALLARQRHFFLPAGRYLTGNVAGGAFGTGNVLWSTGLEWRTETLNANGGVINAVERDWSQRAEIIWPNGTNTYVQYSGQEEPENDNRVNQTRKYLDNGSFAKTEIFYDNVNARANNVAETKEYDFDQTLKRRNVTTYLTTNPDNGGIDYSADDIFLLRLPTRRSIYDGAETERARTVYQYDKYANDGNNAALTDYGLSVTGHDAAYGPDKTTRGNATAMGRWLDTDGSTLFAYSRYDTLGNVVSTKDQNGNVATIGYADNFGAGDNPESGAGGDFGPTFALPTLITSPPPNPGAQPHTAKSQYDFSAGLLTGFKDRNGVITKTEYNDPFNRPTKTVNAKGATGVETQTAMYYAPQSNPYGVTLARNDVLTAKDRDAAGDGMLRSWTVTDGFGRTIEAWTRHPQGDVKVATIYDGMGRAGQISNPHRDGETPVYTTTVYDLAGRVTAVTTPDGATVSTVYNGNQVTVTDQALKKRRNESDALGRLIKVTEDPDNLNHDTFYSYDALDNLRQVTQGAQARTFVYDTLSRLVSATNPESGPMTYVYDPNGNIKEKADARGVKTTMTFDALNRVRSKTYSGTTAEGTTVAGLTPTVSYFYDGYTGLPSGAPSWSGTPSKGRLIGVTYGPGSEGTYYKYDAAGRIVTNHQRLGTSNYVTTYFYNLAGAVTREDRGSPARRRSWMYYDEAGRLSAMESGIYNGFDFVQRPLVNNISYTPFGGLQSETYGNGLIHSMAYNSRQQPTEISLGRSDNLESVFRLGYIYGTASNVNGQDAEITAANNNGDVARIKYFISGAVQYTQTFQYDQLNRLSYAVEHNNGVYNDGARAWYQTFAYNQFGNRGIDVANTSANAGGVSSALQLADFSAANNRITRAGYAYDSAGNLIAEPGKTYAYNAENLIVRAEVEGVGISQYYYDGNSHRVKKIVGGVGMRLEYGAGGELLAEWNDADAPNKIIQKDYLYKGGELLATSKVGNSGLYEYATADHLGSPRAWTDDTGPLIAGGRHDYLSFGEELFAGVGVRTTNQGYASNTQQDGQRKQFAVYEKDSETGLYYAINRYHASIQGRFTSPDPYNIFFEKEKGQDEEEREQILRNYILQPQVWNKYAYALNNPLKYADPDGRRALTADDWRRLDRLYDEYKKADAAGDTHLRDAIGNAINEIALAIDAVPTGAADPAYLKAVFFAIDKLGDTSYGRAGTVSNGVTATVGPGDWKCNIFVANAYAQGAGVGFGGKGVPTNSSVLGGLIGRKYPPAANDYADPSKSVPNFDVVTGSPGLGDVVAYPHPGGLGHSTIHVGGNTVIYAGASDVKVNTITRTQTSVGASSYTIRQYKP